MRKVPKLRFKEFSEEIQNINFESIIKKITYGPRFNSENYSSDGNVKTIRGTDIDSNGEIKYEQIPLAKLDIETINSHKLNDGDLVIITTANCGNVGVFEHQKIDFIASAYAVKVELLNKRSNYFLKYFFQTNISKKEVDKYLRTGTLSNLPASDIKKIKINIPSLQEQEKIANFLSSVDKKISLTEEKLELFRDYKKEVMQKIFSQELRFKDSKGNDYPEWEKKRLEEIAQYRRGSFPQPYGLKEWYDEINGNPFIQVYDVDDNFKLKDSTKNKISKKAEKYSIYAEKGTIIITLQGSIGRVAKMQYSGFIDRTILIFERYFFPINVDFFKYSLFLIFDEEKRKAPGGIIKTITKEVLSSFIIQLPTLEEQEKIADFLSAIDSKIESIEKELDGLKEFKRGLLQQMFV